MSYYSINILSTNDRVGYRKKEGIRWGNENIWFMMPGAELELYLEKGATVKCCRLILRKITFVGLWVCPADTWLAWLMENK